MPLPKATDVCSAARLAIAMRRPLWRPTYTWEQIVAGGVVIDGDDGQQYLVVRHGLVGPYAIYPIEGWKLGPTPVLGNKTCEFVEG